MATVTISLPDDLKTRMEHVERVNWSETAGLAFEAAVAHPVARKEPTMDPVIERLRTSKGKYAVSQLAEGEKAGREWAEMHAEYEELERISKINPDEEGVLEALVEAWYGPSDDRYEDMLDAFQRELGESWNEF